MESKCTLLFLVIFGLNNFVFPPAAHAQANIRGIQGISIMPDVRFTWVIITSDNEISINLRYDGIGTSPPLAIVATAMKNTSGPNSSENSSKVIGRQSIDAGWVSPNTVAIKVGGNISLYEADQVTVIVSPNNQNIITKTSPAAQQKIQTTISNVTILKGIYRSNWATIDNMSIVRGIPTTTLFGSENPVYLVGIIKNNGAEPQSNLNLVFSLFDPGNNLIGVEKGTPEFTKLEPGDMTPYQVKMTTNYTNLDHYLIQVETCDKTIYQCQY